MTISGANEGGKDYSVSVNYTIRKGDNLTTISKATGIPVSILAKDNNIKNFDYIKAGETIALRYHPESWEAFNSPEMNEMFPNIDDQARYFDEIDADMTARYTQVQREGAQEAAKKFDTKW